MEFLSSTDKTIKLLKSVVEHNFKKKKKRRYENTGIFHSDNVEIPLI